MKNITLTILLFLSVVGYSQKTAIKTYSDTTGDYIIKYRYDAAHAALRNNKLHYDAKIAVYQVGVIKSVVGMPLGGLIKQDTLLVGEVFRGVYVSENDAEDNPKLLIQKAKKLKDNK